MPPPVIPQSFHGLSPRQDGDIDAGFSEIHQVSGPAAKPIIITTTAANEAEAASRPGDVVTDLVGG
ncbi:MAG: hypothetical protein K9N47_10375 [Prosthecobacter sp.]|uniref:hypothetical protein n=1 Tax=Prosthecobacter sp. TaxID=1965333 RepID=UPI0025E66325|nr:hypothetical protein [Prosthecobacter sp.]MCF7786518.1 hypothetical protein [Prosthecobacter sp.]